MDASLRTLRARCAAIDAANVYPVPDADTGTNLVMTFEAIDRALEHTGDEGVAHAVRSGALMGARGNAGVIVAQIVRALAGALDRGPAGPGEMAHAFRQARDSAYEAVLEPVEGTILSVMSAAADAVQHRHDDVASLFETAARAAAEALRRTPEQMPLLARSGVVDAGGMGLVAILEAFAASVAGRSPDETPLPAPPRPACEASSRFEWEVQYLLDAPAETIPPLRELLGTIGDSVAVIGGERSWRVHVHTDDAERSVSFGRAVGEASSVETVSLRAQVAAAAVDRPQPAQERGSHLIPLARAPGAAALLAVADGAGAKRLFEELGATVVEGGRGAIPPADAIEAAIEALGADEVIVLPNDDDVFSRAWDVAERSKRSVTVLRAHDIGAGLAAAAAYGDARPAAESLADMREVLGRVRTGQVVVAPAAMETLIGPVRPGQSVAFVEGAMVAIEDDPVAAAAAVAKELGGGVVTVVCGEGVTQDERARLRTGLVQTLPSATLEIHDGGQRFHRYLFSAE